MTSAVVGSRPWFFSKSFLHACSLRKLSSIHFSLAVIAGASFGLLRVRVRVRARVRVKVRVRVRVRARARVRVSHPTPTLTLTLTRCSARGRCDQ